MQDGFIPVDDQRMARVMATLETYHCIDLISQQIDDLALSLVAPLGADNDYIATIGPKLANMYPRSGAFASATVPKIFVLVK